MNLMKIFTKVVKEKGLKDDKGKEIKEGTKLIRGIYCPQCHTFYPLAARLWACNVCGYKVPPNTVPKAWQIKRHDKRQRQQEKWKKEREQNNVIQAGQKAV